MTKKRTSGELLNDRIYHGRPVVGGGAGCTSTTVRVDRVAVDSGVAWAADRLPYTPPQVGMTFSAYAWGLEEPRSRFAAGRADLAYAILDDVYETRAIAKRYGVAFDAQVLQSIPADVSFQIRRSQVLVWCMLQQKADGSLGHSEISGQPPNPATYVCPVCGSLEFETSIRKAGKWCSFYPIKNMIAVEPLKFAGSQRVIPILLCADTTATRGFGWSDDAHAAAGVERCDVFGPGCRTGIAAGGDK